MSKFNTKSEGTKTSNLAGGESFKQNDKLEFVSLLLTSFVKDQFYRSEADGLKRTKELINSINPLFAAKTAIFARNEFGMRSITHVTAGEIARKVKGEQWTRRFFDKVVRRVDDITEILSYYLHNYKKPLPNSLKKGLGKAFDKFDGYQIAKYRAEKAQFSLVDAVNLTHPKHNEHIEKLIKGTLKSKNTWESKLSNAGKSENKEEAKSQAWKDLILEERIGYFALLRNLRNIQEQAKDVIPQALQLLENEKMIKKSLVLPFRYLTAIQEMEKLSSANQIIGSISKALDISCNNVPTFSGKTLVAVDYSASMGEGYGSNRHTASLFGAVLAKSNDADFMIFGDKGAYLSFNPNDSALTLTKSFCSNNKGGWGYGHSSSDGIQVGHGTNFHSVFEKADKKYDRIVFFSDMQGWMMGGQPGRTLQAYIRKFDANPHIYSIDLAGYGTMMFPERNVYCLAGFSEKIFDIMKLLEQDRNALIKKIEEIKI